MSCLTAQEIGSFEALLVDGAEREAVARHLDGCSECRERREKLLGALEALSARDTAPEIAPQPKTWDAIAARIAAPEPQLAVAIACIYCKGKLARIDAVYCAGCLAPHHGECWGEHGACAACNVMTCVRAEIPKVRRRRRSRKPLAIVLAAAGAGALGVAAMRPRTSPVAAPTSEPLAVVPTRSVGEGEIEPAVAPVVSDSAYDVLVRRGIEALAAGRYDEADEELTEAIDIDASRPEAYAVRGRVRFEMEKLPDAMKDLEVAITRDGRCFNAYLDLGRACEWNLDDERADSNYDQVAEADEVRAPVKARALAARARLLTLRSDRVEVQSELDQGDRQEQAAKGAIPERKPLGDLVAEAAVERVKRAEKARALYDEATGLAPSDLAIVVMRARLLVGSFSPDDAAPDLLRAEKIATGKTLAEVRCLLGQIALTKKDWDTALRRFESAVACDPKSPFAVAGLAHAYEGRDASSADARALYKRALALSREASDDKERSWFDRECKKCVDSAVRSKKVEFYASTRRCFARLVEKNPYDALAYVARGRAAAEWHDWDFAVRDALAAIAANPMCHEAWELLGFLDGRDLPVLRDEKTLRPLRLRNTSKAIDEFTRAIEVGDPAEVGDAHYGRALLDYFGGGATPASEIEQAIGTLPKGALDHLGDETYPIETARRALDYHKLEAEMLTNPHVTVARLEVIRKEAAKAAHEAGKALRDKRDYSAAILRFDRATALDPAFADAMYDRGTCYLKVGNFVPGILDFSRTLELDPRFSDQFYNKVYQVSYVIDLNRVITELNKIVAEHPDLSYVLFLRGFFYVAKTEFKKYDRADLENGRRDFDRTLALNPRHASAYVYRGFLSYKLALISKGDERVKAFDAALRDYDAGAKADPEGGIAHFLIAQVYSVRAEDATDARTKQDLIDASVRELGISIDEKDFKGFDRIKNDRGFEAVKNDPRVWKLIQGK